jgi:hypothetical protein
MKHLASFSTSGAYSSVVITTKLSDEIWWETTKNYAWTEDYIQVGKSTFFLSLGSDAVNQLITFYLHTESAPESRPCDRILTGSFVSTGERVFIESIDDMTFSVSPSFFLPAGNYTVKCHSWNMKNGIDVFEPYIDRMIQNVRHEIAFIRRSQQE